jgi:hypothetical protein
VLPELCEAIPTPSTKKPPAMPAPETTLAPQSSPSPSSVALGAALPVAPMKPPIVVHAARPVISSGKSIVETQVPPPVALAPQKPAHAVPRFEPRVVSSPVLAGLVPVVDERSEYRESEPERTPFLGSLEVALRPPAPAASGPTDSDTERLPAVTWEETEARPLVDDTNVDQAPAALSSGTSTRGVDHDFVAERDGGNADEPVAIISPTRIVEIGISPAVSAVAVAEATNVEGDERISAAPSARAEATEDAAVVAAVTGELEPESVRRIGVPVPAPEPAGELVETRKSVPAPKSFAPVPPVVRALKGRELPMAYADEPHAAPADEVEALPQSGSDVQHASPTAETHREPIPNTNDVSLPAESSSLFDLSDAQFSEPSRTPAPAAFDARAGDFRASFSEARESLHEAEESLLDAWAESEPLDSDVVYASVPPIEPAPISVSEPTPSVEAPLYRRRESDVRDLLSQFVVAEARSLRDLARELKTMAGVNATPAPPAVLPIAPEKAAGRR